MFELIFVGQFIDYHYVGQFHLLPRQDEECVALVALVGVAQHGPHVDTAGQLERRHNLKTKFKSK